MSELIRQHTIQELSHPNTPNKVLISASEDVLIMIESTKKGIRLYFPFGADVEKRSSDYIIKPKHLKK